MEQSSPDLQVGTTSVPQAAPYTNVPPSLQETSEPPSVPEVSRLLAGLSGKLPFPALHPRVSSRILRPCSHAEARLQQLLPPHPPCCLPAAAAAPARGDPGSCMNCARHQGGSIGRGNPGICQVVRQPGACTGPGSGTFFFLQSPLTQGSLRAFPVQPPRVPCQEEEQVGCPLDPT